MTFDKVKPRSPAILAAGLALLVFSVLLNLVDPQLPGAGLDPSWTLAAEYASKHHLVFGRDFIFTYGPYHYLDSHLFDPATYPLVLIYEALAVIAVFWVALANRSLAALVAIAVAFLPLSVTKDSVNALALFAAFVICLKRRDLWGVLAAALCAPLALAKYSFVLVILPLFVLADFDRAWARRLPVLTVTFLAAVLAANLLAGQPLSATGDLVRNTLQIVLGYGRAMQSTGSPTELVLTVLLAVAAAVFVAATAWTQADEADDAGRRDLRPLALAAGFAWTVFVLFKMGFVRQDSHPLIMHEALPIALATAFAFLDRPGRIQPAARVGFALLVVLMLSNSLYWRSIELDWGRPSGPPTVAKEIAYIGKSVGPRLRSGFRWATGQKFAPTARARATALAGLKRDFGGAVVGTVDALPTDLAPLIASGLDYVPRPVIQSYSSYTPALQTLDIDHFRGPKAPDTLLLKVDDIDLRLPTLGVGPSLPVIGQRYDAVGIDPLGVVLRRRATPRPMTVQMGAAAPLALNSWGAVPGTPGRLVMAHITVKRTLAGRLVGFLFREPLMRIDLRTAGGAVTSYRFIPDMAQLGVAVSPLPKSWEQAVLPLLDPQSTRRSDPVTGLRLATGGMDWAYGEISVAYEQIALAPGFSQKMPPTVDDSVQLAALMQRLGLGDGSRTPMFRTPTTPEDPALCRGWFDGVTPEPDTAALWRASGWGFDAADHQPFDRVVIVDDAGRLVGAAIGGLTRTDVPKLIPQVRSQRTGWKGVAVRGAGRSLTAYGLMKDGRACPLGHGNWP